MVVSFPGNAGRREDICETEPAGGHLLASAGAAAVAVRFKVKPARSNWRNNSRCPALEIRGSNRGVYFRQGYAKYLSLDDTWVFFFKCCLIQTAMGPRHQLIFVFSFPSCQGRLGGDW